MADLDTEGISRFARSSRWRTSRIASGQMLLNLLQRPQAREAHEAGDPDCDDTRPDRHAPVIDRDFPSKDDACQLEYRDQHEDDACCQDKSLDVHVCNPPSEGVTSK